MERLLDDAERYVAGNDGTLRHATMAFHGAVARVFGNGVLARVIELLVELCSSEPLAIQSFYNDRLRDHHDHLTVLVLAAIRDNDPGRAREQMDRHIREVTSVMEIRKLGRL